MCIIIRSSLTTGSPGTFLAGCDKPGTDCPCSLSPGCSRSTVHRGRGRAAGSGSGSGSGSEASHSLIHLSHPCVQARSMRSMRSMRSGLDWPLRCMRTTQQMQMPPRPRYHARVPAGDAASDTPSPPPHPSCTRARRGCSKVIVSPLPPNTHHAHVPAGDAAYLLGCRQAHHALHVLLQMTPCGLVALMMALARCPSGGVRYLRRRGAPASLYAYVGIA